MDEPTPVSKLVPFPDHKAAKLSPVKTRPATTTCKGPASVQQQQEQTKNILLNDGIFNPSLVEEETNFWYEDVGLPNQYFVQTPPEVVARHIHSFQAAKAQAAGSGHDFDINLKLEEEGSAMFAARSSVVGGSRGSAERVSLSGHFQEELSPVVKVERYIEERYISGVVETDEVMADSLSSKFRKLIPRDSISAQPGTSAGIGAWRLQAFRSRGHLGKSSNEVHLRLYFLQKPEFVNPNADEKETRLEEIADKSLLGSIDEETKAMYQKVVTKCVAELGPAIEMAEKPNVKGETVLMIAHHIGSTHSYFTGIPDVYRYHLMYATRKYVEPFANGVVVFTFHLASVDNVKTSEGQSQAPVEPLSVRIQNVKQDASLHYVLPRTSVTPLLRTAKLSAQETAYAYCAWKYAFHFLNRDVKEFHDLEKYLAANNPGMLGTLNKLRSSLKQHAFTEGTILDTVYRCADLIPWLYDDFASRHRPSEVSMTRSRTFSRHQVSDEDLTDEQKLAYLRRNTSSELDTSVLASFLQFNNSILRTNFYKSRKAALAFQLDPSCLSEIAFPKRPFGLFYVIGAEFRGFHIRFRDVARGGIRLVRSAYAQAFTNNVSSLFDECYNLANTQQRKNKDIPEGGSKGVILLNLSHQQKGRVAFEKYVDSIMDLLLPEVSMVDLYEKEQLLFFGPDEGTAEMMDWASAHARRRGYKYWKAFTTGKSLSLGGIPHDRYGMTTNSVRQYVLGIQKKLSLDPNACTKVQTGGPDGDLGSNEILEANEKTIAIVDGSGVLYDPQGINREELVRLAKERRMVEHVDKSVITGDAFLTLIGDKDVTLPSGQFYDSGLALRNGFHLHDLARGDFFVPCGGRPNAVTNQNVEQFLYGSASNEDASRTPRFKYIVEGANLFFTQAARLTIEKAGLIVFKDASANKGGVTSSSLEVLAALALTDAEFGEMMAVKSEDTIPQFYQDYVRDVQAKIRFNAQLEFECLWNEHERTGKPRSVLSDELSVKITELSARIEENDGLWENVALRKKVLVDALPKTLVDAIGFDQIVSRLPETYARALYGSQLASRFIYKHGLETPEFAFYQYVSSF